jgi:transcriptional regulator with XRE-family HTH domain
MSLGEKIRELRRAKNWSQRQFGLKINVHEKNVSRYENDKSVPSAPMLRKIADVFGVTIDYLLSNEAARSNPVTAEIRDPELLECFLEADKLSDEDREVVKKMVHAFAVKNAVDYLAKEK